ncbi:Sphingolipid C4-hydroxylase sur2 [Stygiomarasmius scandens]|uniref:Sphingolipid C4-hydroxylase sur2 n=1 Tax=Marasmiellus scandens TaxID=2682957 RepID=A0ABR1K2Q6_9AGAR
MISPNYTQGSCSLLSANTSVCFSPSDVPFYYSPKPVLVEGISDPVLTLAAPIIAYWASSLLFHSLDISGWKWLDRYRIHESQEVKSKNRVTKTEVVVAVIFQHIVQTALGYVWLEEKGAGVNHMQKMEDMANWVEPVVRFVLGETGEDKRVEALVLHELGYYMYWWAIPAMQLLLAMFIIDTWQYFLHRFMHVNKWFYKRFHSWHHRLYVPYAFGALYNHPLEGFVLDTLGAALAEYLTGMTTRQALVLFTISTFKTVDDHCGYKLPFDPLQLMSGNNADYHDIHHQQIGIKSNFAQPFFIHWDVLLGTRMTRAELEQKRRDRKAAKDE